MKWNVELLLEAGADVNITDSNGDIPLHEAVSIQDINPDIVNKGYCPHQQREF